MDFVPEDKVFQIPPEDVSQRHTKAGYDIGIPKEIARSKDGELLSVFEGVPLPRKGCIYAEAIVANNQVKRLTLSLMQPFLCKEMLLPFIGFVLTPYKWKVKFLERYLQTFVRLSNSIYNSCVRIPYLEKEYYNNLSKALWDMTVTFLTELGISKETANDVGRILATTFEYDDAYKLRIEDPMSEFTKEEVLMSPQKFLVKFIRIMKERNNLHAVEILEGNKLKVNGTERIDGLGKIEEFIKIAKYLLYLPKFKKAFKKTIKESNFKWLQLDDLEIYWALPRIDYDVQGRGMAERWDTFYKGLIRPI